MSEKKTNTPTISNRKAFHEYTIVETFEAGISLQGTEVKSLRAGKANFTDAFAFVQGEEVWLKEFHISPYDHGSYMNHEPKRDRKLLLHKKEIRALKLECLNLNTLRVVTLFSFELQSCSVKLTCPISIGVASSESSLQFVRLSTTRP